MSETTNIGWTNHTASPWFGCTEVDECCTNCYSREMTQNRFARFMREAYRKAAYTDWETMPVWGVKSPRVLAKSFWKDIYKWNAAAKGASIRPRTFTSMIDWLDDMPAGIVNQSGGKDSIVGVVGFYLKTIFETPNLDHLLLTKRPENFWTRLKDVRELFGKAPSINDAFCCWLDNWLNGDSPHNVWFGYTAGTRKAWIERYDITKHIPCKVRWVSAEPLLEALDFHDIVADNQIAQSHVLDWIVIGGESGSKRRDKGVEILCQLAEQAHRCGCKVFVKQDCAFLPGQQGRIPDHIWSMKQFPTV
jgi:protein gp37